MKTLNQKIYYFILVLIFIGACAEKTDDQNTSESAENVENKIISITQKQFESSGYQISGFDTKSFKSTLKVNGKIHMPIKNKAGITSLIGGVVSNMNLYHGQKVNKGQRLFTLTNPELIDLQQEYLELKGQLSFLEAEYLRQKSLSEEKLSPGKNILKADSDLKIAQAKYAALEKKLEMVGINPDNVSNSNLLTSLQINAPLSGYVSEIHLTPGAFLKPYEMAMEIDDTDHLHLELKIMERDISKVKVHQKLQYQVLENPDQLFEAEVHLIEKLVDEDRMVNLHCHLAEKDESNFIPGMYVIADLFIDEKESFALPEAAIVNLGSENYVAQLENPGSYTFVRKKILTGITQNGYVEILNSEDFGKDAQFIIEGAYYVILNE